jgi:hypothetical protein
MTVGQELAAITGLKLFHNHMTIELVRNFFSVHGSEEGRRLNALFRQEIFEAVANSDLPGLIFTYMFDFDEQSEYEYINSIIELFETHNAETSVVELHADFDIRIERNKTENRLLHKPSKRDIQKSEELFRSLESSYRLNSYEDEVPFRNYLKINNSDLMPNEVALKIKDAFNL